MSAPEDLYFEGKAPINVHSDDEFEIELPDFLKVKSDPLESSKTPGLETILAEAVNRSSGRLDLKGKKLCNADVDDIVQVVHENPSITWIDLRENSFTQNGIDQFLRGIEQLFRIMECKIDDHLCPEGVLDMLERNKLAQEVQFPHEELYDQLRPGTKLYAHQLNAVVWMYARELDARKNNYCGGILAHSMGLGKTMTSLALISLDPPDSRRSLIVCPKSVMLQWKAEAVHRFFFEPDEIFIFDKSSCKEEYDTVKEKIRIVITSYSILQFLGKKRLQYAELGHELEPDPLFDEKWHRVICDEAHRARNPRSLTFRAISMLKSVRNWWVTGTPIVNKLLDIQAACSFLRVSPFCEPSYFTRDNAALVWREGDRSTNTIPERLPSINIVSKDILYKAPFGLPKLIINEVGVDFGDAEANLNDYMNACLKEMINELELAQDFKEKRFIFKSLFQFFTRIRQLCDHHILFTKQRAICKQNHQRMDNQSGDLACLACFLKDIPELLEPLPQKSTKLKRLMELIQKIRQKDPGRKILIFSQFTRMLKIIGAELSQIGIGHDYFTGEITSIHARQAVINNFYNEDNMEVLLINLHAGGVGLNLTCASVVILYEYWWNDAIESQAIDRAHRLGQQNPVEVFKLRVNNTLEDWMYQIKQRKIELTKEILGIKVADPETKNNFFNLKNLKGLQQYLVMNKELSVQSSQTIINEVAPRTPIKPVQREPAPAVASLISLLEMRRRRGRPPQAAVSLPTEKPRQPSVAAYDEAEEANELEDSFPEDLDVDKDEEGENLSDFNDDVDSGDPDDHGSDMADFIVDDDEIEFYSDEDGEKVSLEVNNEKRKRKTASFEEEDLLNNYPVIKHKRLKHKELELASASEDELLGDSPLSINTNLVNPPLPKSEPSHTTSVSISNFPDKLPSPMKPEATVAPKQQPIKQERRSSGIQFLGAVFEAPPPQPATAAEEEDEVQIIQVPPPTRPSQRAFPATNPMARTVVFVDLTDDD